MQCPSSTASTFCSADKSLQSEYSSIWLSMDPDVNREFVAVQNQITDKQQSRTLILCFLIALSGKGQCHALGFLPSAIQMHQVRHFRTVGHVVFIVPVGVRKDLLHVGERLQSVWS